MRLIDVDDLGIGRCNPDAFENKAYADGWNAVVAMIENAPTVDAEPARHGKWTDVLWGCLFECSECKGQVNSGQFKSNLKYCPNCGAKMQEESEKE